MDLELYLDLEAPFQLDPGKWLSVLTKWIKRFCAVEGRDQSCAGLSQEARKEMFAAIMRRHSSQISRICFAYARNRDDLNDLRQDVYINIWRGLATYRSDCSETTWLYRVALNTCVSFIRKRNRRIRTVSVDEMLTDIPDNNEGEILRERITALHRAISTLSPLDKAIITMRLDDHTYEEIAQVTGLSRNNVATRLHRIKIKLSKTELQ